MAEFLEDEGGMVQHVLLDVVLDVHADLAGGAQFGLSDGTFDLRSFGGRKEFRCGKHRYLKEMSGAFSVPSWASK